MPKVPVDPPGDQDVSFLLLALDEVVEVGARVDHGRRPCALAYGQHCGAEDEPGRVYRGWEDAACEFREVVMMEEAFDEGHPVRDVVCFAVT